MNDQWYPEYTLASCTYVLLSEIERLNLLSCTSISHGGLLRCEILSHLVSAITQLVIQNITRIFQSSSGRAPTIAEFYTLFDKKQRVPDSLVSISLLPPQVQSAAEKSRQASVPHFTSMI